MHAFDWPEQTLKIYMQYSTYFACNNDLCSAVLTNVLGDIYFSAFCRIWALNKALRRVTSAKGSQKSEYYMLAFDWLEQTDKIGYNIFPARMTCAELWCRLFGNTFLNFVSNFSLEGGNWVICLWQHHISKMWYFKCYSTILFNICTISFYLIIIDINWLYHVYITFTCLWFCWFLHEEILKLVCWNLFFLDSGSPRERGGVLACMGMVCYHCIVHILNSSKKPYFLCLSQRFVQSYASKLPEDIFLCFVPN